MTSREQCTDSPSDTTHTPGPPIRGMAVLCSGRDEFAEPAIAVWHIAVSGALTGAWITQRARLDQPDAARRALILLERCALLVWDPERPLSVLAELIGAAQLPAETAQPWGEHLCRVSEALTHVRSARAAHAAALADLPSAAPLQWQLDLPGTDPADLTGFLLAVRRVTPGSASPVASGALELATAARWCLQAWQDTESTRIRRPILRQRFGPEQSAPPPWAAALYTQRQQKLNLKGEACTRQSVTGTPPASGE